MKVNNKGFTLVELIATLVVLALVMGIGSYSITAIIQNSKEKEYSLLIEEINNAIELYYQECKYVNNDCTDEITLGELVSGGFLKGNSSNKSDEYKYTIINPNNNMNISSCKIKYDYIDGQFKIEVVEVLGMTEEIKNSCPTTEDYNN